MTSSLESLYVMAKLKRTLDKQTLDLIIAEVLLKLSSHEDCPFDLEHKPASIFSDGDVGLALWCLGQLGEAEYIHELYNRDTILQSSLRIQCEGNSKEFVWHTMRQNIPGHFPILSCYRRECLNILLADYPELKRLISALKLELI